MQLSDQMKNCLLKAMEETDLDLPGVIEKSMHLYVDETGAPIQVEDEEEFADLYISCASFVTDQVLSSLILKGVIEVEGFDGEDLYYQLTENFREELNGQDEA